MAEKSGEEHPLDVAAACVLPRPSFAGDGSLLEMVREMNERAEQLKNIYWQSIFNEHGLCLNHGSRCLCPRSLERSREHIIRTPRAGVQMAVSTNLGVVHRVTKLLKRRPDERVHSLGRPEPTSRSTERKVAPWCAF